MAEAAGVTVVVDTAAVVTTVAVMDVADTAGGTNMCKPEKNLLAEAQVVNTGLKHFCFDIETGNASADDINTKAQEAKVPAKAKTEDEIRQAKIDAYQKAVDKAALLDRAPITVLAAATEAGNVVWNCIPDPCPVSTMPGLNGEIRNFKSEKDMLIDLREWLTERTSVLTEIIGFNSKGFDLPKLRNAYIRHRLQLPALFVPGINPHYDVMREYLRNFTTEFNGQMFVKLKTVQSRFGLPEYKEYISGADAPKLAAEGKSKLVIPYCYMDTITTYLAYKFMTGQIEDVKESTNA